jgi:hypothetical protein
MKFSSENLEGLLKDLGVDENTILKPIVEKYKSGLENRDYGRGDPLR